MTARSETTPVALCWHPDGCDEHLYWETRYTGAAWWRCPVHGLMRRPSRWVRDHLRFTEHSPASISNVFEPKRGPGMNGPDKPLEVLPGTPENLAALDRLLDGWRCCGWISLCGARCRDDPLSEALSDAAQAVRAARS